MAKHATTLQTAKEFRDSLNQASDFAYFEYELSQDRLVALWAAMHLGVLVARSPLEEQMYIGARADCLDRMGHGGGRRP